MKKKMTNAEMDEAIFILKGLHESGKLGYAIARNIRKLEDEAKEYIDFKMAALKKYGNKKEYDNGTYEYTVSAKDKDKLEAYLNELGDIPEIEQEVDIFTVPEDVFYNGTLTSDQMSALLWMVE